MKTLLSRLSHELLLFSSALGDGGSVYTLGKKVVFYEISAVMICFRRIVDLDPTLMR